MLILLLFCAIIPLAHCVCPSPLTLTAAGECRGKYTSSGNYQLYQLIDGTNYYCRSLVSANANPVAIHNDEQQSYWSKKKSANYLPIGLTCNTASKKWQWADNTMLDFKPTVYDAELDVDCKTGCSWVIQSNGDWNIYCDHTSATADYYCIYENPKQPVASDDCGSFDEDGDDTVCYEIAKHAENWKDAQAICHSFGAEVASVHSAQENSYIRRLAVSAGATNGLMIGGTVAGKGVDFGWVDGSEWDYSNFYPGFPIDGLGECLTMDTLTTAGQWMNTDCSAKLPVACARPFHDTPETLGCTGGPWKEGQIIYSPGFPNDASVPCDYFLTVPTGKLVKLEILLLEANGCCDHLLLTDGYTGGTIIANLTGDGLTGKYYYTTTSNTMRVSWQPNGGVNVRGLMMSYWTK